MPLRILGPCLLHARHGGLQLVLAITDQERDPPAGLRSHCLVAEIAYDGAPIVNRGGVTMSPATSDKLAQRNLQVTHSDNPGPAETHRVPQTFDVRPSAALATSAGDMLDYPDELMIDWAGCRSARRWSA